MYKLFIIILSLQVSAGAPLYTVLEQTDTLNSSHKSSINILNAKSNSGDHISFVLNGINKNLSRERKVEHININGQTFEVGLQDDFDPSQSVPFFKLNFPDMDLEKDIYVLAGPRGTSGASFHYFVKGDNGQFTYSGLHPEITFDEEQRSFYSVEKDGPRAHLTKWKLENDRFIVLNKESIK